MPDQSLIIALALAVNIGIVCGRSVNANDAGAASGGVKVAQASPSQSRGNYSGAGRYTLQLQTDQRQVFGLHTLAGRHGVKPYRDLETGKGEWQSERVIFRDVDTGATIIRYTNDPFSDQLSYFQGNWSADGKYAVFRRRPGMWEASTATHGPMAVNADGTNLRNVFRDYRMVRHEVCSPKIADVCYATADGDRRVVAFDISTGREIYTVREMPRGWHLKISPDGNYLMDRSDTSKGKGLWISSIDGGELHEIAVPESIHDSYCFHPHQRKVMFWYEDRRRDEGFTQCDFDGVNRSVADVVFDWNHGAFGRDRGVHTNGFITRILGEAWGPRENLFSKPGVEYYDDPMHYNGYLSWQPKDQLWVYATRIADAPHVSELQAFPAEPADGPVNRFRVCSTALRRGTMLDNPNASPDGTKVLFNSNGLGSNNIYGAVARLPEAPTKLVAKWSPDGVHLSWSPPAHQAEIAGYHVYGSRLGGTGYLPLTGKPVTKPELTLRTNERGREYFYAVTAIEHSGIESSLSAEASPQLSAQNRRVYVEAEHEPRSPDLWLGFDGAANDLHYVWMRSPDGHGAIHVENRQIAEAGLDEVVVWARVRSDSAVHLLVSAEDSVTQISAAATTDWTWVRAAEPLRLGGAQELELVTDNYGTAIDALWLSGDESFDPRQSPRITPPPIAATQVTSARALSPYSARIAWQASRQPTFHHYNVYCGLTEEFAPGQSTLVASPDRASLVDWALAPATNYFYRITCVDRFGNESAPAPAAVVRTADVRPYLFDQEFAGDIAFTVPAKDDYVVWLLLRKSGEDRGYINVKCFRRDTRQERGQLAERSTSLAADAVAGGGAWTAALDGLSERSWLSYDQWARFALERGEYVLKIVNETGSTIERVCVTNDLSYVPDGHINILTGW